MQRCRWDWLATPRRVGRSATASRVHGQASAHRNYVLERTACLYRIPLGFYRFPGSFAHHLPEDHIPTPFEWVAQASDLGEQIQGQGADFFEKLDKNLVGDAGIVQRPVRGWECRRLLRLTSTLEFPIPLPRREAAAPCGSPYYGTSGNPQPDCGGLRCCGAGKFILPTPPPAANSPHTTRITFG